MSVTALLSQVRNRKSFRGTQQNLYSYSRLAWNNYLEKLTAFTGYSAKFTQAMGDDALDAIAAAEALPSYEALTDAHLVARMDLIKMLEALLAKWQDLKVYATEAFAAAELPSKLRAAGADHYGPAAGYSWDSAAELIRMGTTFLSENGAALLANDNMPSSFPAAYVAAGAAFSAQRVVFLGKEKQARNGIVLKSDANEAIHASLVAMTTAGRAIYRQDANERRNFTVAKLLKEVRGNSPGGIKGHVTTGMNPAVPLAGVLLVDQDNPERFAVTASDGSYELRVPSGMRTVVVSMEGYATQELLRKIDVGTMHRQSFSLEPVPAEQVLERRVPVSAGQDGLSEALSAAVSEMGNGVLSH